MSSAGINFGGLASGLDTKAIISALVAVERRPINALETKKTSLNGQKKLFGDFSKLLGDLQTAAKKLSTTSDFLKMATTSSNEDLLGATATSSARPGTHSVVVRDLARAQMNASGTYADQNATTFGTGTLLLTKDGQTYGIEVGGQNGSSLADIAAAINAQSEAQDFGVSAQVVDTGGTGNDRYQLVLRSTEVGSEGAFSLTLDNGNAAFDTLVNQLNAGQQAGTNAVLDVDGVRITRSTNSVADAIEGVTLDLRSADTAKTVTVTVTTDSEETSKNVQGFVDAYNKVVDFIAAQNVVGENGTTSSPLFGDGTLRSARSLLRQIVGSVMDTDNDAISMLSQIGITSDRDGKLTFNQSKFADQLGTDEQAVTSLFIGTGGIATRLSNQVDVFTRSTDGLIKARSDGFDRMIRDTQRRIDAGEQRLTRFQQALEVKYANLESLLGKLQSQGNALSGITTRTN